MRLLSSILLFLVISILPLNGPEEEICNDGIDNDQDGFVDNYDEDCECNEGLFNSQCEQDCNFTYDKSITVRQKWSSTNISNGVQAIPSLVANKDQIWSNSIIHYNDSLIINLISLNQDGDINNEIAIDTTVSKFLHHLVIANINGSNSIFVTGERNVLHSFHENGSKEWSLSAFKFDLSFSNFKIVKYNENEFIYAGHRIINASTGDLVFEGTNSKSCNFFSQFNTCSLGANSIAADFTTHSGFELACGNTVYQIDLVNENDTLGNFSNIITAPEPVNDGFTSVADVNGDGLLDIVVVRSNQLDDGGVWVWDPRLQEIIASENTSIIKGNMGGVSVIVDLDSDCIPEIIVPFYRELRVYNYENNELTIRYILPTTDESGAAGPTAFDLNGDGNLEIIYRDETEFKIIDGPTGDIIFSQPMFSGTRKEHPIVTSFGEDEAKILVSGGINSEDSIRIFCFESANEPWAPARKVWNQTGYHVTNVNDDLTIPQYQQNSAAFFDTDSCAVETCSQVYNTFGVQATYRTQQGCRVFEQLIPELESDVLSLSDCPSIVTNITATSNLDSIRWYPIQNVDCQNCDTVNIQSDTSINVIVVAYSQGCEISDTLHFEAKDIVSIENADTLCFGDSIIFNGDYIQEEGLYAYDSDQCDTTFILDLKVQDSLFNELYESICQGDSLEIDSEVFTIPGQYEILLQSQEGCDSTIFLDLEVKDTLSSSDVLPICEGDSILIEDQWYFGGETVEIVEVSMDGCDSLINLFIEVEDVLTDDTNINLCEGDSILLHNTWIKEEGEYPGEYSTESGCDSIFTYFVNITPIAADSISRSICEGDSIIIESQIFKESGEFDITLLGSNGCDSVLYLNLDVLSNSTGFENRQLCPDDSIQIENTWYYGEGEFTLNLQNEEGCDSTVTLMISALPYEMEEDTMMTCIGDSILINGAYYYSDQLIIDTISGEACPKIRSSNLLFLDVLNSSEHVTICKGDTMIINEIEIYESGEYPISFTSQSGCDSIHTVSASILEEEFNLPSDTLIAINGNYDYTLDIDTSIWSIKWTSEDVPIECSSCLNQTWNISDQSIIELEIFSIDGCEMAHVFVVDVEKTNEIVVPNIFTPNNDGINDLWMIDMTEFPINKIRIYDRWGGLIHYQSNQQTIIWDGKFRNTKVVTGVYVYSLEFQTNNGQTIFKYGDITVIDP